MNITWKIIICLFLILVIAVNGKASLDDWIIITDFMIIIIGGVVVAIITKLKGIASSVHLLGFLHEF